MRGSSKKISVVLGPRPLLHWLILCFISLLALIAVLRSSPSSPITAHPITLTPVSEIYTSYRILKEQVAIDYSQLRRFSSGYSPQREVGYCGKEYENFVPCYNVSKNLQAGLNGGEEFDRHCEIPRVPHRCLIRPPKEYKIPLSWPVGRDIIWSNNVKISKDQFLSSGSMTKRLMLLEENQIAFHSDEGLIFDDVKDYSRQIAEMIGLGSESEFFQAGVRTIIDVGCGFGSFGAYLSSLKLMAVCVAAYELSGSQVQLALERGLPAIIGNFISRQLPFPSLSFDMLHCAQCGIVWDKKDGAFLIEVDRVLKPGGYFVVTSPTGTSLDLKKRSHNEILPIQTLAKKICWSLLSQQDETFIWQKTSDVHCYETRNPGSIPVCLDGPGPDSPSYYQPLLWCLSGATSKRWLPIQNRSSGSELSSQELQIHGIDLNEFYEDKVTWKSNLRNYWSLLTPLIFSDHPKRPGDEDPLPPFNMLRNVMDMNARYGGLNYAFLESKRSVWVMNVVPINAVNTLPLLLYRGFAGVSHDWCEPFPTYPQTYDMLHAKGLLSLLASQTCSLMDLFLEMDRILRPEGWIVVSDTVGAIEMARRIAAQVRWEARVIDLQNGSDQRLLVCQKPFFKK